MFIFKKIDLIAKKINKLEDKMDQHQKESDIRLDKIEKVLVVQEANLKEHMKRSDSLERLVNNIEEKELKPLNRHVAMVDGAFKLLGLLGVVVGIIAGIVKTFDII